MVARIVPAVLRSILPVAGNLNLSQVATFSKLKFNTFDSTRSCGEMSSRLLHRLQQRTQSAARLTTRHVKTTGAKPLGAQADFTVS